MNKRQGSVHKMLTSLLPPGGSLPSRLIATLGEHRALRVARALSAMAIPAHRKAYAPACIRRQEQIDTAEDWLAKHPPYEDIVDEGELREMSADICARHREIRERKERIAVLRGEISGFELLVDAKGHDKAAAMFNKIAKALSGGHMSSGWPARISTILRKVSTVRHPEAYIAACIKNERARLAKQKNVGR
jgi:hypothetical protein